MTCTAKTEMKLMAYFQSLLPDALIYPHKFTVKVPYHRWPQFTPPPAPSTELSHNKAWCSNPHLTWVQQFPLPNEGGGWYNFPHPQLPL